MAKRNKKIRLSQLAHLISRLFLLAVFLFLVIFFVQAFAGNGNEFKSAIEATYIGAFYLAVPLTALMVLFAGYQYVTAGFDADQIKQSKETLIYAIGGLLLLVLGYRFLIWLIQAPDSPLEAFRNWLSTVSFQGRI